MDIKEFELPDNLMDCSDLAAELWLEISECKDKKLKAKLIVNHNKCATLANKFAGKDMLQIISSKTKVEVKPEPKPKSTLAEVKTEAPVKTGGIIEQIISLHKKGLSNKEIVEQGFNKSTVNRQVSEYKKRK